jgi:hypothetical protein
MKIFNVTVTYGYGGGNTRKMVAVAKDIPRVIELVGKMAKKSYWSEWEIINIVLLQKIDLIQK